MHMKKATNITASSCIKEADPYEIATEDQVTLETLIEGIPASLVQAGSAGYASEGQAWDFALPAIHIATESMTGDVAIGGNIGYDWFAQWGTNEALGADFRDARRHAEVLSGLRLRLSGHVLPRSGASVRVQGEQLH